VVPAFLLRLCEHCSHPLACHPPSFPCSLQSPDFWVLVAALRRFIEGEGSGQLPLEGSIPDMHASTQQYLELQRIYRAKADAGDTDCFTQCFFARWAGWCPSPEASSARLLPNVPSSCSN
jgi:hypothetical protein